MSDILRIPSVAKSAPTANELEIINFDGPDIKVVYEPARPVDYIATPAEVLLGAGAFDERLVTAAQDDEMDTLSGRRISEETVAIFSATPWPIVGKPSRGVYVPVLTGNKLQEFEFKDTKFSLVSRFVDSIFAVLNRGDIDTMNQPVLVYKQLATMSIIKFASEH